MTDIYSVKNVATMKIVADGFDKKQDAKAKRNELCKEAWQKWSEKDNKDKNKPFPYVVTKGKEHPRLI
tara:strand:- start:1185 stop:1388 length:204 start_codon:yes stop_codon:yes gene_type:complete